MEKKTEFPLNLVSEELNNDVLNYIEKINIKTEPLWTNTIKNNLMIFYSWLLEKKYLQSLSPSTDSSEVSYSDVFDRFKKMNWEHEYTEMGIMNRNDFERAVDSIRSKLKSQWVSVEKNLPVMYDEVLVIDYTGYVTFAKLGGDEERFYESRQEKEPYLDNITHWMPLPESLIK